MTERGFWSQIKWLIVLGSTLIVMIGYSDNNKDAGLASARWTLHEAQIDLAQLVSEQNIELNLFHGRAARSVAAVRSIISLTIVVMIYLDYDLQKQGGAYHVHAENLFN